MLLFTLVSLLTSSSSHDNIHQLLQVNPNRPPTPNGHPLDVRLGMYLESLGNFQSSEMSFDVDLYVYMSWRDARLRHSGPDYVMLNDDAARKKMWILGKNIRVFMLPDVYFSNARTATFQSVTKPNFNLFIAPDGQIAYSCRCTLTVACSLDLRFYPMDHQICSIRVLSYAHIASQVNISWFGTNAMSVNPEVNLPEFTITSLRDDYCNGTYRYALMPNSSKLDEFSCLSGKIFLSRALGYNILQSYIPMALIVMISWVSFWIDRRAVPARITLSFTTLVSFTTLGSGLKLGLPQVSYAKAIDLWYGGCLLFVFFALLEFALINNYMRKAEKFENLSKKCQQGVYKQPEVSRKVSAMQSITNRKKSGERIIAFNSDEMKNSFERELLNNNDISEDRATTFRDQAKKDSRTALSIDQYCRIIFPCLFSVFCLVYWWYYLILHRATDS